MIHNKNGGVIESLFNAVSKGWKLQRRSEYTRLRGYTFKILAVIVSLLIASLVLEADGVSALEMGKSVLESNFRTEIGRKQFLRLATPLIINGAAMLLGLRMRLFNFGLEGQLYAGAFVATAIGLYIGGPHVLVLVFMFLGGMIGGAVYSLIPAVMRIRGGVSEILTTLLLNPLAIQFAAYIGMDAWRDFSPAGAMSNATPAVPYGFPKAIWGINLGFIIAVLVVILLWIALSKTIWGYEITAIGASRDAARYAGMMVVKHMFSVILISGALAGLSGMIELAEGTHRYSAWISQSYGWLGINVAILAGFDPLAVLPWGLFFALILSAGTILKVKGISVDVVIALTGLILLLASIGEVVANYRLVLVSRLEKDDDDDD